MTTTAEIKIFYSWQSDLPGNTTRGFLQDCIEGAVSQIKDTIEVEADRDTKGELGTPEISQTIFSKIDECDLFIADVSIINKYLAVDDNGDPTVEIKLTPNPNVLLELGYAAKTLGWDRVICFINTDYGRIEDLPFDLSHRRVTGYSLSNTEKAVVRKEFRDIIALTIMDIKENGTTRKNTEPFAKHIVGYYDKEENEVIECLKPVLINESLWFKEHREKLLIQCGILVDEIKAIKLPLPQKETNIGFQEVEQSGLDGDFVSPDGIAFKHIPVDFLVKSNKTSPVIITESESKDMVEKLKNFLNIDLPFDFFFLGGLKKKTTISSGISTDYIGSDEEKEKHYKILDLQHHILKIMLADIFMATFDGMKFFPLAIYNSSTQSDTDLTICICFDVDTIDIALPTGQLFNSEYKGLEGMAYEEGLLKGTLMMPETADIHYDKDISYNPHDTLRESQRSVKAYFSNSSSTADIEDYEREIQKYIASPTDCIIGEFEFSISTLRPKEKKWLGAAILVCPKSERLEFSYSIKSQHSDGTLSGVLVYDK